jgi:hypothetical protein
MIDAWARYYIYLIYQRGRIRRFIKTFLILSVIAAVTVPGSISCFGQGSKPTPAKTPPLQSKTDQSKSSSDSDKDSDDQKKQDDQNKTKRGSWIFAPIPINSPAFGSGLILGVGYVFRLQKSDEISPPSVVAAAGAITNNGTRGLVLGSSLYFGENKYKLTVAAGTGRANYEFFGIGRIPGQPAFSTLIKQHGAFFFGEFMRNFGKNIFIGPRYQYRKLTATFGDRQTQGGFEIPAIDLRSTTAALGFHIVRDLRNSNFYPTKGSLFEFRGDFFGKALGSNRNYQSYLLAYNGYRSIGKQQVLAYRAMTCSVSDKTPFFDLCLFGSRGDLRGYTAGEFQNRRMFALQAEYRRDLGFWRLGFTAFGGVGGVARRWNEFSADQLLPGGGVGLRFKLDKQNHINYRVDLGFGRSGHTLTMSVTEAF